MTDFRILNNVTTGALRFADRVIDTHVIGDVAHVATTRTSGTTNPLHVLTFGELKAGLFRPTLWTRETSNVVRGTGASAFDDAVKGLHNLGERHGIEALSLAENPNQYGGLMRSGGVGYESGDPILKYLGGGDPKLGKNVAYELDAAARRVLDFIDVPAGG